MYCIDSANKIETIYFSFFECFAVSLDFMLILCNFIIEKQKSNESEMKILILHMNLRQKVKGVARKKMRLTQINNIDVQKLWVNEHDLSTAQHKNWWAKSKILIKDYNADWQFRTRTHSSTHHHTATHTHIVPIRLLPFERRNKRHSGILICLLTRK